MLFKNIFNYAVQDVDKVTDQIQFFSGSYPVEETVVKKRKSFEKCHIIYDSTYFAITAIMTVLGAVFIKESLQYKERVFFIITMIEMQLFGLLLKATYYLYMHPWEDLNPRLA